VRVATLQDLLPPIVLGHRRVPLVHRQECVWAEAATVKGKETTRSPSINY